MQLFLDVLRRMLMAVLAVVLAQIGLSIEPDLSSNGREVQRSPECAMVLTDPRPKQEQDC